METQVNTNETLKIVSEYTKRKLGNKRRANILRTNR